MSEVPVFEVGFRRYTVWSYAGARWRAATGAFDIDLPGEQPWIGTIRSDDGHADVFPPREVVEAISRTGKRRSPVLKEAPCT